jgi:hypothetical protein
MTISGDTFKGRILEIRTPADGYPETVIDNGVVRTITIVTTPEVHDNLMAEDMAEIQRHLMTRGPERFRVKSRGGK